MTHVASVLSISPFGAFILSGDIPALHKMIQGTYSQCEYSQVERRPNARDAPTKDEIKYGGAKAMEIARGAWQEDPKLFWGVCENGVRRMLADMPLSIEGVLTDVITGTLYRKDGGRALGSENARIVGTPTPATRKQAKTWIGATKYRATKSFEKVVFTIGKKEEQQGNTN